MTFHENRDSSLKTTWYQTLFEPKFSGHQCWRLWAAVNGEQSVAWTTWIQKTLLGCRWSSFFWDLRSNLLPKNGPPQLTVIKDTPDMMLSVGDPLEVWLGVFFLLGVKQSAADGTVLFNWTAIWRNDNPLLGDPLFRPHSKSQSCLEFELRRTLSLVTNTSNTIRWRKWSNEPNISRSVLLHRRRKKIFFVKLLDR